MPRRAQHYCPEHVACFSRSFLRWHRSHWTRDLRRKHNCELYHEWSWNVLRSKRENISMFAVHRNSTGSNMFYPDRTNTRRWLDRSMGIDGWWIRDGPRYSGSTVWSHRWEVLLRPRQIPVSFGWNYLNSVRKDRMHRNYITCPLTMDIASLIFSTMSERSRRHKEISVG